MRAAGGIDLVATLTHVDVPSFIASRKGRITWLNDAARAIVGDVVGGPVAAPIVPEHRDLAREQLARKLDGVAVTNYEVDIVARDGQLLRAAVSSVPIEGGDEEHAFLALVVYRPHPDLEVRLTPRQMQVLHLLADGHSTAQIATQLHLTKETVRNYVRLVLRALDAHSRLEAVAIARRRGLL